MRHLIFWIIVLLVQVNQTVAKSNDVENRLYDLEHKVKIIDSNQINYKIEKDLLKETYSNNYKNINLFITIILGMVAILGYMGIKDIGTIKEKYNKELGDLKEIKSQFDSKYLEFYQEKEKIDEELKTIIKENQEQNKKIKFIELKEKTESLFKEKNLMMSLDFCNAALDINPTDSSCLSFKGAILVRINQLPEALLAYKKAEEHNPENVIAKLNLVECLYFLGQIDEGREIIRKNKMIFDKDYHKKILGFLEIIKLYHDDDMNGLKEMAKSLVTNDNLNDTVKNVGYWSLEEAQSFAYNLDDSEIKTVIQNIIWYLNEQLTGKQLLSNLGLPLPIQDDVGA